MNRRWIFILLLPTVTHSVELGRLFQEYRERQAREWHGAQAEKKTAEDRLRKIKALRANLHLPEEIVTDRELAAEAVEQKTVATQAATRITIAEYVLHGGFAGVPTRLQGTVVKMPERSTMYVQTPLIPGETLKTDSGSHVQLAFEDGSLVKVLSESEFELQGRSPSSTDYLLKSGTIQVTYQPRTLKGVVSMARFQTPSGAAIPKQGTFDVWIATTGWTHVILDSGQLTLEGPGILPAKTGQRWWMRTGDTEEGEPNVFQKWGRVTIVEGDVRALRSDGIPRRAAGRMLLGPGERLETGAGGRAWMVLKGGAVVALPPHSRLSATGGKQLTFRLDLGEVYVRVPPTDAVASPTTLRAGARAAESTQGEWIARVSPDDTVEWIPLSGSVRVQVVGQGRSMGLPAR